MSIDRLHELRVSNPSGDSFSLLNSIERGEGVQDPLGQFLQEATQLRNRISNLHQQLSELERAQRLTLTDPSGELLSQLDNKTHELKLQFSSTKAQYDQLVKLPFPAGLLNQSQLKIRSNKLINLGKALESAIVIFSDIQRNFYRSKQQRINRIIQTTTGQTDATNTLSVNSLQHVSQIYDAALERDPKLLLEDYQLRHEDLLKLEQGMQEIHSMFLELSHMVAQQGELIDQVEQSADKTNEYTEKGVVQIVGATKKAKLKRVLKIMGLILLAAVIIVVLGYIANICKMCR